jgi:hypothetical protein
MEYLGVPNQKYCDIHKNPHNRKRIRPKGEKPGIKNQIFLHEFMNATSVEFTCALPGCGEKFRVQLYPRQYVYPKYCDKHRSEYQRFYFERTHAYQMAG